MTARRRHRAIQETSAMSKSEGIGELYTLAEQRLFGDGPWLADGETYAALHRKIDDAKLWEPVPGTDDTYRPSSLGRAVNVTLLMIFLGLWHDAEIPIELENQGLMSEDEVDDVFERYWGEKGSAAILLPYVRRAFRQHFRTPATVN
jgi:hypothetical protein